MRVRIFSRSFPLAPPDVRLYPSPSRSPAPSCLFFGFPPPPSPLSPLCSSLSPFCFASPCFFWFLLSPFLFPPLLLFVLSCPSPLSGRWFLSGPPCSALGLLLPFPSSCAALPLSSPLSPSLWPVVSLRSPLRCAGSPAPLPLLLCRSSSPLSLSLSLPSPSSPLFFITLNFRF